MPTLPNRKALLFWSLKKPATQRPGFLGPLQIATILADTHAMGAKADLYPLDGYFQTLHHHRVGSRQATSGTPIDHRHVPHARLLDTAESPLQALAEIIGAGHC